MQLNWAKDGLTFRVPLHLRIEVIKYLKTQGYKWGQGEAGYGLYSSTWDRQLEDAGDFNTSLAVEVQRFLNGIPNDS